MWEDFSKRATTGECKNQVGISIEKNPKRDTMMCVSGRDGIIVNIDLREFLMCHDEAAYEDCNIKCAYEDRNIKYATKKRHMKIVIYNMP